MKLAAEYKVIGSNKPSWLNTFDEAVRLGGSQIFDNAQMSITLESVQKVAEEFSIIRSNL